MKRPARAGAAATAPTRAASAPRVPATFPVVETPRGLTLVVGLIAALCALAAVSNRIIDWDFWQHVAVGKAIWRLHEVPALHLWTWSSYGQPGLTPSWLFRVLLWPFWSAGGVTGMFAWRWLTTLGALAVLMLVARRLGARGLTPLAVLTVSALVFRTRSQMRPETLVAVLMALQLWILETRRQGGPDRTPWLVANAWVWVNAHVSYPLGFALLAIHGLDALITDFARRGRARIASRVTIPGAGPGGAGKLVGVAAAALALSFANPFGWRALWEPFEYFLHQRHEPMFTTIGELQPVWVMWPLSWRNGLPLLLIGWPILLLWRARRRGLDRVELLTCALFTWLGLNTVRFTGFYALVAAPYVARALGEWLSERPWVGRLRPGWRATAVAAFCVGLTAFESAGPLGGPTGGIDMARYPVGACDFMAEHGVRGRGFNHFYHGGYQIFRFWPDRDRLPFIDIHQTGTPVERTFYILAQTDSASWLDLDRRRRFDYVLLSHTRLAGERLPDLLDADPAWALVYLDDAASLYVRRDGPLAPVARRFGYRKLPGGLARLASLRAECRESADSCAVVIAELERAVAGSRHATEARSLLANALLLQGRLDEARRQLETALAANPDIPRGHERLGLIALEEGRADDALRELAIERRLRRDAWRIDLIAARAHRRRGDEARARAAYQRVLRADPSNLEARDSLAVLGGR